MGNAVHVQAWLLWSLFQTKPHGLPLSTSHTSVGWSYCGQWHMFTFRTVKVHGLAMHLEFRTHSCIWYCEGSCVWDCFHPRRPLLGLWHYLIRLQVCLLSHDSTECQVREQRQSLKAQSLETFMGTIQGCLALEDLPEFIPRFPDWKSSSPSSVPNITAFIHLTTISQTIQILVRWSRYSRGMTLETHRTEIILHLKHSVLLISVWVLLSLFTL